MVRPAPASRREKFAQRWHRLETPSKVALIGSAVTLAIGLISAVPAYITATRDPQDSKAAATSASPNGLRSSGLHPSSESPGYSIIVNANSDTIQFGRSNFLAYVFPKGYLHTLTPPHANGECANAHQWAHENGGADLNTTIAEFTITSQSAQVVAESVQLEVVDKSTPPAMDMFDCPMGDVLEGRILAIDLPSGATRFSYQGDEGEVSNAPFGLIIKPGDAEKVQFWADQDSELARPKSNDIAAEGPLVYRWHLKLNLIVDGQRRTAIVDDNGKPFVTYARLDGNIFRWHRDKKSWEML